MDAGGFSAGGGNTPASRADSLSPQIVGVRSGRQGAWIDVPHYLKMGVRLVFTVEWTEPQAIAGRRSSVRCS